MKKILIFFLIFCLCLCFAGCAAPEEIRETEGLSIVTTIFPAYDFARQIAGDCAEIRLLIQPGSEAHSFEPTPQDMIRIESCDLLICCGGESEEWLEELLEGTEREIPTVVMLDCVDALEEEEKEGMQDLHEDGDEEEYDEHVWTSPRNAMRICACIREKLTEADGEHAALYAQNCAAYTAELEKLDESFREIVENARRRTLIFADRFPVRYFTEEYGLDYFAAFPGCADDVEPSAKTVAFLIDKVREEDIPYVLYIEFSNEKMADIICEDTGCGKLLFHSCHNLSADEFERGVTYLELMRRNAESLKEALG